MEIKTQSSRKTKNIPKYTLWKHGHTVQINYSSIGCKYRKAGSCLMCNYGAGVSIGKKEITESIQEIDKMYPDQDIRELVFGTCGSIFDRGEMSRENFKHLLSSVNKTKYNHIILEGHYSDITEEVLQDIKERIQMSKRVVSIEMGLESSSNRVRIMGIEKHIDNNKMIETIDLIHKYGFRVILNVLYGIPGLTIRERQQDCLDSIKWVLKYADNVVVFPINIKPNTYLMMEYKQGRYIRVTHNEFIRTLDNLTEAELDNVYISWFGDRQASGIMTDVIPPASDIKTDREYLEFYENYVLATNGIERKQLIKEILA